MRKKYYYACPPQQVHDGVIVAEDDKSSHTQSRTTASTNSCLKRSRRKVGMDNAYICVYAGRFIPGTEDAILKGMQDDESLRTCTHSGVKKRTGKRVCVDKCSYMYTDATIHAWTGTQPNGWECTCTDADASGQMQTQMHGYRHKCTKMQTNSRMCAFCVWVVDLF